jgi:GNAT superfamily N-acetyltransferase
VVDPRQGTVTVGPLRHGDRGEALAVLARAFWPDPLFGFFAKDRLVEHRMLPQAFSAFLADAAPFDQVHCARVGQRIVGAAMWVPPGSMPRTARREALMQARLVRVLLTGQNRRKGIALLEAVDEVHPHEPHWYLALLGTDPLLQGRGVGSTLLAPNLARADEDGVPVYLETQKEENLAFYRRHGFDLVREVRLPGTPAVWCMQRAPHQP